MVKPHMRRQNHSERVPRNTFFRFFAQNRRFSHIFGPKSSSRRSYRIKLGPDRMEHSPGCQEGSIWGVYVIFQYTTRPNSSISTVTCALKADFRRFLHFFGPNSSSRRSCGLKLGPDWMENSPGCWKGSIWSLYMIFHCIISPGGSICDKKLSALRQKTIF